LLKQDLRKNIASAYIEFLASFYHIKLLDLLRNLKFKYLNFKFEITL